MIFLHGWTLDHRMWRPQMPLADDFTTIMPDRRGFGRSAAPAGLALEWQDVEALASGERFALVGLSQGAAVALDYARRRPQRVAALVLAGAPLHGVVPHSDAADALPQAHYARLIGAGGLERMKADWRQNPLVQVNPAARELLDEMLADYDGRDLLAEPAPLSFTAEDIAALPMPVLALAGQSDSPWRRQVAQFLAATAPRGRLALIDRAGHLCNLDNPARFNAVLADFLHAHVN